MNALILNSAHGKFPVGSEGWIQATLRAVRGLTERGECLLCSTAPLQWDILTWLAGNCGAAIRLIVKTADSDRGRAEYSRLLGDFALDSCRTAPIFLEDGHPGPPAHPKDAWPSRDRLALTLADAVYPVSIRPGGRLDSLMREPEFRGKLRPDFRIPWSPQPGFIPRYTLTGRDWKPLPRGKWLVHWTRTCPGKWPGETDDAFYRDLFARESTYVRSAPDTLKRMLDEGRIRGSGWRMPGNVPGVAFTELSPGEAFALMQWRKRHVRYTFEPFGIAVRTEVLSERGAEIVAYTREPEGRTNHDPFLTHAAGDGDRWMREREWRLRGDLLLDKIPAEALRVIVPDAAAAGLVRASRNSFPVHILFAR